MLVEERRWRDIAQAARSNGPQSAWTVLLRRVLTEGSGSVQDGVNGCQHRYRVLLALAIFLVRLIQAKQPQIHRALLNLSDIHRLKPLAARRLQVLRVV